MPTANEIRRQFIDFFCQKHRHTFVPSSPVVPQGDPTLLFANAGMNQFKPYFLGTEKPPYKRVANTQKCIRAGGKHNDLDDVGKDTYHHTFFEMLGNWSFGDYFKKEAIRWAWELLTGVWKMDKSRLHVTVFEGDPDNHVPRDDEAAQHWRDVGVDPAHVHLGNKKDNFWEMGDTGPCGPCTEIHYDKTPDKSGSKLVNKGSPDVIEIWNLVFIQFNRNPDKSLTPLPAKHVDTGMGFERVTAVLQGKTSNYDTDVFTPLFDAIRHVTGAPAYTGQLDDLKDTAYRVIADHIRALTFALTDGATPGNVGRGYVLRSILRRAERYGRQYLGTKEPFLLKLVPAVVDTMGEAFPELKRDPGKVRDIIREEEDTFIRTFNRGVKLFDDVAARTKHAGSKVIAGKDAFDLHTTYGFFVDITEQMAAEQGLSVDRPGFQKLWDDFTRQSGVGRKAFTVTAVSGKLPATDDSLKYAGLTGSATVRGWVDENQVVTTGGLLLPGKTVGLILDQTCFYPEAGGQVGDAGSITGDTGTFQVETTQKLGDTVLHIGSLPEGMMEVGQGVRLAVATEVRRETMRHHTTTHLLNLALRKVLGPHVEQKGSLVDADKTRFDFAHDKPITPEQLAEVEEIVNAHVRADLPVTAVTLPLAEAKRLPGVRAVFGEKYPDPVRVVMIGPTKPVEVTEDYSVEFCGGTHLERSSQAGLFKVVSQEGVAKGVRRIIAVAGAKSYAEVQRLARVVDDLTAKFNCKADELPARVESLQAEVKELAAKLKKGAAGDLQGAADKLLADAPTRGGAKVIVGEVPAAPMEQMRGVADRLRQLAGSCVIVLGWKDEEKVPLLVVVTNDLVPKGLHAGNLIKPVVELLGGKGGGKPEKAEAGGKDAAKLGEALALARKLIEEKLK